MTPDACRSRNRGQALVEFALVLPIIVVLILGTLDVGRAVFVYNTLSEASRQGARTAIVNQNASTVQTAAVNNAPASGLSSSGVDVCFKQPTSGARDCLSGENCAPMRSGCLAIVTAHLAYDPLTPLIGAILGPIVLSSTSVLPIEYACGTRCP